MADMMKLLTIQTKLNAPKSQYNPFGKFYYRNAEDILGALKPLMEATKTVLLIQDNLDTDGDDPMLTSTATLYDAETATAIANASFTVPVETAKKGMDGPQRYGAASSYARKYALNGLFAIDDTRDPDSPPVQQNKPQSRPQGQSQARQAQPKPQELSMRDKLRGALHEKGISEDDFAQFGYKKPFNQLADNEINDVCENFDSYVKMFLDNVSKNQAQQEEIPF